MLNLTRHRAHAEMDAYLERRQRDSDSDQVCDTQGLAADQLGVALEATDNTNWR